MPRTLNPDLVAGSGQDGVSESDADSRDARSGAKFNRSSDSAALVEVTNEAHLSYAKLCIPVDHWIHPWGLSAIKHQGKDEIRTGIGDHPPGALLGARGTDQPTDRGPTSAVPSSLAS